MTEHTVHFVNEDVTFTMSEESNDSILDAAEKHGLDPSYQCRMGHCGICAVRIEGDVEQEDAMMLTPSEKEEGYVLTCVATPRSDLKVYTDETP
ncbi:2Fe-2S iron-sulfur cluster-binding protein [Natrarchaeobius oligotrophus]|uniref:(2Fe-2S)-binding protein n=1 Tax=Natrarchaeobius chitinivorans TaxID=1679083 RepID=A0A3N6PS61_NATCH|nr:2Fe-2S iron-sulfur cluster binding domain-containing protein [Natrarchaeobius chitinivorans]RQH02316.1 (2Fe-2S)-binding protein [Natrarchaeobius chitinivorans]